MTRRLILLIATACMLGAGDALAQPAASWTQRAIQQLSPPARTRACMVYDSARTVCVLFGGATSIGSGNNLGDTWEWNGAAWSLRATTGPAPRRSAAMAFDSSRGVTVLFGGEGDHDVTDPVGGETWEWDGQVWTRRLTAPTPDFGQWGPAMAFDTIRAVCVLVGGWTDDVERHCQTWDWNGQTWTQRAITAPRPRRDHAVVFDVNLQVLEMLAGYSIDPFNDGGWLYRDGWHSDGSDWTLHLPSTPAIRLRAGAAFDSFRNRTVLFGGDAWPTTTTEYDGAAAVARSISGPRGLTGVSMCYDSARHANVLFGGSGPPASPGPFAETWEYGPACPADYNADGSVAPADLAAFIVAWLFSVQQGTLVGDMDGDGAVVPSDLSRFVGLWFGAITGGC